MIVDVRTSQASAPFSLPQADESMIGMRHTERTGVDIRVALSSKARMLSSAPRERTASAADRTGSADPRSHSAETASQATERAGAGLGATLKRGLRPVARAVFKVLKPIGRPFAFRLRAYLFRELQLETQALHEKVARDLEAHKQSQLEAVERLLTLHTTHVLREVQAMRESLRRDFSSIALDVGRQDRIAGQLGRLEDEARASAYRVAVACGPDEVLLRTAVGYVLCPASDHALLAFVMESRGELERGTRLLIQKLLRPGDTFVDAGANIGMHTLAAATAVGEGGRIVAFEPLPSTHELLRKSIWTNGFSEIVETHQAAVSNRQGRQPLFLGATSGHHSLYPLQAQRVATPPAVEVPLVRIDDVLGAGARVDVMKIDVEGAELEAVEGAGDTIANNPGIALIVEFGISHLRRTGHSTEEWLQHFERLGLGFSVIDPETGALREGSLQEIEGSFSVNLFFARPGSEAWKRARGTP